MIVKWYLKGTLSGVRASPFSRQKCCPVPERRRIILRFHITPISTLGIKNSHTGFPLAGMRERRMIHFPCKEHQSTHQGSYTTGPSKFQDFSRTFKDHIYKNPGPVIARKTETIQTIKTTNYVAFLLRFCKSLQLLVYFAVDFRSFFKFSFWGTLTTFWLCYLLTGFRLFFDRFFKRSRWAWCFSTCITYWRAGM